MIRDFRPEDADSLISIHKNQGFQYPLPDLTSPSSLILVHKVREINGQVVASMFLRGTTETFLLVDGSPVAKGKAIEELQPEVLRAAWGKGLNDCFCVVPPQIEESFSPVLARMGWTHEVWPLWSRRTE